MGYNSDEKKSLFKQWFKKEIKPFLIKIWTWREKINYIIYKYVIFKTCWIKMKTMKILNMNICTRKKNKNESKMMFILGGLIIHRLNNLLTRVLYFSANVSYLQWVTFYCKKMSDCLKMKINSQYSIPAFKKLLNLIVTLFAHFIIARVSLKCKSRLLPLSIS